MISRIFKINGEITKYYKFKGRGSGSVTIPLALAKALNWEHGNGIYVIFDTKDSNKGLFLFKKED